VPFPVVNFTDEVAASSVQQVVMVADNVVTMLVDDAACAVPASQLSEVCKNASEQLVGPFDEADCLDGPAAGDEYAEDEMHQRSLCMMADVADSYEDRTMITMDRMAVVCDGQVEERECCELKGLSSTPEQVLDHNG